MTQKIIILVVVVLILSGAVVWMYTLSGQPLPGVDPGNPIGSLRNIIWPPLSTPAPTVIPTMAPTPIPTVSPVATSQPGSVVTPRPVTTYTPQPVVTPVVQPTATPTTGLNMASMWLDPMYDVVSVGKQFAVNVMMDTGGANVVAVTARISFDSSLLAVENIDTSDSNFSIEAENIAYPNEIRITRGQPNPGFKGSAGKVATIYFTALKSGSGDLQFEWNGPGEGPSRTIQQGNSGQDILGGVQGMQYVIQ